MLPERGALLLDTHVWIWAVGGATDEIPPTTSSILEEGSRRGRLLVSVISVWELAVLEARQRIRLPTELEIWVQRGLRAPGVRLAELTTEIAIESTRLPPGLHRDPADRILVATARRMGARLVTRDTRILAYARAGHVAAVDAGR